MELQKNAPKDAAKHLAQLVGEAYKRRNDHDSMIMVLVSEIRSMGLVASFLGGLAGMEKLQLAAEAEQLGGRKESRYVLDIAWNGIGDWEQLGAFENAQL